MAYVDGIYVNVPERPISTSDVESVLQAGSGSPSRRIARAALILIALAIPISIVAFTLWSGGNRAETARYETQPAVIGDLTVTVTATGTVQPTNEVDVSSELSGIVRTVDVDFNDLVKAGQALAMLDTDKLKAEVERSRAALAAAQAKVEEAEASVIETQRDLERIQQLATKDFSTRKDLDAAKATYDRAVAGLSSAKADVAVAKADLDLNETDLKKACICSPIDGVVLVRNVDPGQTVASSLQAPVLFQLADNLEKMQIEVDVDEADMGKVREGQGAVFQVEAYPDREFPAQISQLRLAPETVESVVTYKAVLTVDNRELLLRPGMTATAEIIVQELKDVLLVPNAALRFTPPSPKDEESSSGNLLQRILPHRPRTKPASEQRATVGRQRQLWVLRDGQPTAVPVTIGATDGTRTQIVSGDIATGVPVIVDVTAVE
jgi:HlyD family secretion protein